MEKTCSIYISRIAKEFFIISNFLQWNYSLKQINPFHLIPLSIVPENIIAVGQREDNNLDSRAERFKSHSIGVLPEKLGWCLQSPSAFMPKHAKCLHAKNNQTLTTTSGTSLTKYNKR